MSNNFKNALTTFINTATNVFFCIAIVGTFSFYFLVYAKEDHKPVTHDIFYTPEFNNAVNKRIEYNSLVPRFYNGSGQMCSTPCRFAMIRVALTASPQTVDISAAGFTNVYAVFAQGENNTGTVANMPNCTTKSFTTTGAIINTTVGNTGIVGVLAGLIVPASFTGMYVNIAVFGN